MISRHNLPTAVVDVDVVAAVRAAFQLSAMVDAFILFSFSKWVSFS